MGRGGADGVPGGRWIGGGFPVSNSLIFGSCGMRKVEDQCSVRHDLCFTYLEPDWFPLKSKIHPVGLDAIPPLHV